MRVASACVAIVLAAQSAATAGAASQGCPLVLAHRGDTRIYPANTIPAFEQAIAQGFDGVELDVHFSSDRVAIVSHDDKLAVATTCSGRISQTPALKIVNECVAVRTTLLPESRVIAKRSARPAKVPSLDDALRTLLADRPARAVVIDIKPLVAPEGAIEALRAAIPCSTADCRATQRRITFITQNEFDARLLNEAFADAHVALESTRTVSGLIDDLCPKRCPTHWFNQNIDTYSISFNSLFDPRLLLVKLARRENLTPKRRFNAFYRANLRLEKPRRLLGWTISSRAGIRGQHAYKFHAVLTDLTSDEFWRLWRETAPPGAPACGPAARQSAAGPD